MNNDTKALLEKYNEKFACIETNLMAELFSLCESIGLTEKEYIPMITDEYSYEDFEKGENLELIERLLNCYEKVGKLRINTKLALDARS